MAETTPSSPMFSEVSFDKGFLKFTQACDKMLRSQALSLVVEKSAHIPVQDMFPICLTTSCHVRKLCVERGGGGR